jgi:hypothetical protein
MDCYHAPKAAFSHGVVRAFDLTNCARFREFDWWLRECIAAAPPNPVIVVYGNKANLQDEHKIAAFCASPNPLPSLEASAYTGQGVKQPLRDIRARVPLEGAVEPVTRPGR